MENRALWFRSFGRPADVLSLEAARLPTRPAGSLRVRLSAAPINPSDLIPITGAYRHRVFPPLVAGYEGLGIVMDADDDHRALIGRRVLPLRGPGTWQQVVDGDPRWAVAVPDDVDDALAARGYINPLAAHLMLKRWPAAGRRVLLTAAGSSCADLLAQWALAAGAREVVGIYRSETRVPTLKTLGVTPINLHDAARVTASASRADLVFDAVGGPLATAILSALRADADFVAYGLLSGAAITAAPRAVSPQRFHLRDMLDTTGEQQWQGWFRDLWPLLKAATLPAVTSFPMTEWKQALAFFDRAGRSSKPLLVMD